MVQEMNLLRSKFIFVVCRRLDREEDRLVWSKVEWRSVRFLGCLFR